MELIKNKRFWIILVVILLGCFLRIYENNPASLWTDEFATYWISSAPSISWCVNRAAPTQGQSPFYYVLVWAVLKIFSHNEFSLRLVSMISSIVSIFLFFYLALIVFSEKSLFEDSKEDEKEPMIESKAYYPALFSTLLLAVNGSAIYYSQEARPYSLAIMFCIISQIFFFRIMRKDNYYNIFIYIAASSFICYSHYVFGTLLITQNVWMLYLYIRKYRSSFVSDKRIKVFKLKIGGVSLLKWCVIQLIMILSLLPLGFHLFPILSEGGKWNWLQSGGLIYVFQVFSELLHTRFIVFAVALFIFLISMKNFRYIFKPPEPDNKDGGCCFADAVSDNSPHMLFFLFIWFLTPPLFVYAVSKIFDTSIIAPRYMILSYIPLFLIGGWAVSAIKNKTAKKVFIGIILFFYCVNFLIPVFLKEGRFSKRIPHDWRGALTYLDENYKNEDYIFLRTGLVKENWGGDSDSIIARYVKSPIQSFYLSGEIPVENVYNMTFTPSREFEKYYDKIFANLAKKSRVWIIGVSQPNGFPIQNVEKQLYPTHIPVSKQNFDGVYLALLVKKKNED